VRIAGLLILLISIFSPSRPRAEATATPPPSSPPKEAPAPSGGGSSPSSSGSPEGKPAGGDEAEAEGRKKEIEEKQAEIERLRAAIAAQQQQLEALMRELELLGQQLARMQQAPAQVAKETAPPSPTPPPSPAPTQPQEDQGLLKPDVPDEPPEGTSVENFPGSFHIPGTRAAIKVGGLIWVSLIETLDPLGSSNQFLTYSIPVGEAIVPGQGKRLSIWAGPSRINLDYRTRTSAGEARAFIEGDFAGLNGTLFRLRFAFVQFRNFLIGQSWSTFSDHYAEPEDTDFEGINAENDLRQPQIRYTWEIKKDFTIMAAIENPAASVSGGQAVSQIPDITGRITRNWAGGAHFQGAVFVGNLRAQSNALPDETESARSYGVSLTGIVPVQALSRFDRFIVQANAGTGIAHYINDLKSAGGQDGAFDPENNDFQALTDFAAYLTYEHHWTGVKPTHALLLNDLRSSLIWGYVEVKNLAFQPADAYHRTNRMSVNVLWTPISDIDIGAEYIWGQRVNKDGEQGSARQVQVRTRFQF
jgi:uncharacterized coiled-coil protein SlyX